jgi:hypothetical protein
MSNVESEAQTRIPARLAAESITKDLRELHWQDAGSSVTSKTQCRSLIAAVLNFFTNPPAESGIATKSGEQISLISFDEVTSTTDEGTMGCRGWCWWNAMRLDAKGYSLS